MLSIESIGLSEFIAIDLKQKMEITKNMMNYGIIMKKRNLRTSKKN